MMAFPPKMTAILALGTIFLPLVRAEEGDVCSAEDVGEYDLGLHIASVFVMLIASGLGVFLPVLLGSGTSRPLFRNVFFVLKHFGTGIIVSLA